MKSKWYFVIASVGVLGFAVWFQDFHRRETAARTHAATAARLARTAALEDQARERAEKIQAARRLVEHQRMEQEEKQAREARVQAGREAVRHQLTHTQGEVAGLHRHTEAISREIADESARLEQLQSAHAALAAEQVFLADYIATARASIARVHATAARLDEAQATSATRQPSGLEP